MLTSAPQVSRQSISPLLRAWFWFGEILYTGPDTNVMSVEREKNMPKINKVAHVVLAVSDVARSKAFYRDVLGMELISDRPDDGPSAFLSFGTQHHDIALFQAPSGAMQGEMRLIHAALQLEGGREELKEMVDRLEGAGVVPTKPVTHGITNSVYFQDPDGHTFEIYIEAFATAAEGLAFMREQTGYGITDPITL